MSHHENWLAMEEETFPVHALARRMLRHDFHGLGAAEAYFGPWKPGEREARVPLCLRDHRTGALLSEEETLRILAECKGSHVMLATRDLTLLDLWARHPAVFLPRSDQPWFSHPSERNWAGHAILDPWLLIRKSVLPDSVGLTCTEQQALIRELPKERELHPAEFCYAARVHLKETGEALCKGYNLRFPSVRTAAGDCVGATLNRIWLSVYSAFGNVPIGFVGACTARMG